MKIPSIGSLISRMTGSGSGAAAATSAAGATAGASAAGASPKALNYGVKGAGAVGLLMCIYDAHKEGKRQKEIYVKKKNNEAAQYWFDNTRNLHNASNINAKLKDKLFFWETKSNLRGFLNAGIGYVKGFFGMLATDIVPVAISAAALCTKGKTAQGISGAALGLYALYGGLKNVLGVGVNPGEYTDKHI